VEPHDEVQDTLARREGRDDALRLVAEEAAATLERDRALKALTITITGASCVLLPLAGLLIGVMCGLVGGVTVLVYRLLTTGTVGW
jgi:hypothetical protein